MKVRAQIRSSLKGDALVKTWIFEAEDYHEAYSLATQQVADGWLLVKVEVLEG